MRDSNRRTKKYKVKLDGTISQLRLLRYGKEQKRQFKSTVDEQVKIEREVKRMITNVGSPILTNYYILAAKQAVQASKKHKGDNLTTELNIIDQKWKDRGLDEDLLTQIKQYYIPGYTGLPVVVVAGWEKIVDEQVTGAAVTSIDVTGLDLDAGKTYLMTLRVTNPLGAGCAMFMYFNNDLVNANYYAQYLSVDGGSITAGRSNFPDLGDLYQGTEGTWFFFLQREVGKIKCIGQSSYREQSAVQIRLRTNCWVTENNVTRITIVASAANAIGVGSRFIIFKVAE